MPDSALFPEIVDPLASNYKEGKPVVRIVEYEWNRLADIEGNFTLIGKFLGPSPPLAVVRENFRRIHSLSGSVSIELLNARNILVVFSSQEDCRKILMKRWSAIKGRRIVFERWTPNWSASRDSPLAMVWIYLPNLPLHLFNLRMIARICAPIGTVVMLDSATCRRTRPNFAKARVEIDLSKPLAEQIRVEVGGNQGKLHGFWQKIEYESVPRYCVECWRYGHSVTDCRRRKVDGEVVREGLLAVAGSSELVAGLAATELVEEGSQQRQQADGPVSPEKHTHNGLGTPDFSRVADEIIEAAADNLLDELANEVLQEQESGSAGGGANETRHDASSGELQANRTEAMVMSCDEGAAFLSRIMKCDRAFAALINRTLFDVKAYLRTIMDANGQTYIEDKGIITLEAAKILVDNAWDSPARGRFGSDTELNRLLEAYPKAFGGALCAWAAKLGRKGL